jgi:hypothetical protein
MDLNYLDNLAEVVEKTLVPVLMSSPITVQLKSVSEILKENDKINNNNLNVWGKKPVESSGKRKFELNVLSDIFLHCGMCDYTFGNTELLQKHMIEHDKGKNFRCPDCNQMFGQKINMKSHYKIKHEEYDPVQCTVCNKFISTKHNLIKHMMWTHAAPDKKGKEKRCKLCDTDMRGDMARHQRSDLCKNRTIEKNVAKAKQ